MGRNIKGINKDVEEIFSIYTWPGNVRELKNTIEFAVNLEDNEYITVKNIPSNIKEGNDLLQNKELSLKQIEKLQQNYAMSHVKMHNPVAAIFLPPLIKKHIIFLT
jgi:transcriptional regulator with PAS, ATPase and Fis domain